MRQAMFTLTVITMILFGLFCANVIKELATVRPNVERIVRQ